MRSMESVLYPSHPKHSNITISSASISDVSETHVDNDMVNKIYIVLIIIHYLIRYPCNEGHNSVPHNIISCLLFLLLLLFAGFKKKLKCLHSGCSTAINLHVCQVRSFEINVHRCTFSDANDQRYWSILINMKDCRMLNLNVVNTSVRLGKVVFWLRQYGKSFQTPN